MYIRDKKPKEKQQHTLREVDPGQAFEFQDGSDTLIRCDPASDSNAVCVSLRTGRVYSVHGWNYLNEAVKNINEYEVTRI